MTILGTANRPHRSPAPRECHPRRFSGPFELLRIGRKSLDLIPPGSPGGRERQVVSCQGQNPALEYGQARRLRTYRLQGG